MPDRRPDAAQTVPQFLQRLHHRFETRRRRGLDLRHQRALLGDQARDGGLDVLRPDGVETRQRRVFEQRIIGRGSGHRRRPFASQGGILAIGGRCNMAKIAGSIQREALANMASDYDLIVIGGGSGGLACAQRAAEYGARVMLVEMSRLGGTCVNVGCVPKKVMWNAGELAHALRDAAGYGFDVPLWRHDWPLLKQLRDEFIERINAIYQRNLDKRQVELLRGHAKLLSAQSIQVGDRVLSAGSIGLATGGRPLTPPGPGAELGLSSGGFFQLR